MGQLKESLAGRVGHSLKNYDFWLQETQMLSDEMTLVEQCIQGEGLVQIKVEISNGKINIVDLLKPEEDLVTESKTGTGGNNYDSESKESVVVSSSKEAAKETNIVVDQDKNRGSDQVNHNQGNRNKRNKGKSGGSGNKRKDQSQNHQQPLPGKNTIFLYMF